MLRLKSLLSALLAIALLGSAPARGCPFCVAESLTLTEEIDAASAVIIA